MLYVNFICNVGKKKILECSSHLCNAKEREPNTAFPNTKAHETWRTDIKLKQTNKQAKILKNKKIPKLKKTHKKHQD